MSVWISVEETPAEVRMCQSCDGHTFDCLDCGGSGWISPPGPSVNITNANVKPVFDMLGYPHGLDPDGGAFDRRTIDKLIRGCLRALNSKELRERYATEEYELTGQRGAKMIVCSMDEAYLKRKAREILVVLRRAKRENRRVVWS